MGAEAALFFPILPFIVTQSSVSELTTWRACPPGMAGFGGVVGTLISAADLRLNRLGIGLDGDMSEGRAPTSLHMRARWAAGGFPVEVAWRTLVS